MTRDTCRASGERDIANDAEVYAALWQAAPFPHLPEDAPNDLKKLTIDIDDPRRVYNIHKASRRHHFQLLVERYIRQIRYGCQARTCATSTCFSCRKRLAKGAPVRRYNATSARTLAIYMASLDNPERGLCHHPSAPIPTPEPVKPTKPKRDVVTSSNGSQSQGSPREREGHGILSGTPGKFISAATSDPRIEYQNRKYPQEAKLASRLGLDVTILEEPPSLDHRSFVQNVFGTVAFKMLEWLTPANLSFNYARPDEVGGKSNEGSKAPGHDETDQDLAKYQPAKPGRKRCESPAKPLDAESKEHGHTAAPAKSGQAPPLQRRKQTLSQDAKPLHVTETRPNGRAPSRSMPGPNMRRQADSIESQSPPMGILSKSPKVPDAGTDFTDFPSKTFANLPKQKLARHTLITGPQISIAEITPVHEVNFPLSESTSESAGSVNSNDEEDLSSKESHKSFGAPAKQSHIRPVSTKDVSRPQSLSHLPTDIIDLLCDILQLDGTSEKHLLQPRRISDPLKRRRTGAIILRRTPWPNARAGYTSTAKEQWRMFIEQSFFDVLGNPESLIRTFSDEKGTLFDSQTMWYLMLRMTRVAPSVVFDRLWSVAGTLFRPPQRLEEAHDWARSLEIQEAVGSAALSNQDAAKVINICLHALVAAAPLLADVRQIANMSRIRSYGLAMLGREVSSMEPASLCLHYEDAFTYELAVRLARRLFRAIPTRQYFSDLIELQKDVGQSEEREPNVLEIVLDTIKTLDVDTSPFLNFTEHEQELHEKRVPTLVLDWARTVMLQDWQGSAVVQSDGPFGGALATMAAIYRARKSMLLGDIYFRTEYFSERLDAVEMPLEWLSFEKNKRTTHLLDHPYLFNPSTLVTYFRAINYSRMNKAYEQAKAAGCMIYSLDPHNHLITNKNHRDKLYSSLSTATSKFMVLDIRRELVLEDTFESIWRREERELMRPLKVRLGQDGGGEEGFDLGGVQQEYFRLAIAEALNPDYGTFTVDATTKMTWFQPGSIEPLWKFELIGMIVSLAVYNGLTLPVTFPKALYRKLLDEPVTELHHIADGWPELANGLTALLEWDEKDGLIEDIFARTYEYSVEQFGQPVSREMGVSTHWPQFSELQTSSNPSDAPLVTCGNRNNYVGDYIGWLTDVSIRPQFEAFRTGFFTCIDRRSISLFGPDILQSVVEGVQDIDISELRRVTRYVGFPGDAAHKTVRDFWSVVKRFDHDQKRKLLEFVTASDRVPVGGMRNLSFTVQRNGSGDGWLPSSYTCFGVLLLPEYSSKEVLREKLRLALENSKGFGNL